MDLYLRHGLSDGSVGTVFHLRERCAAAPDSVVHKVSPQEARDYRERLGIRRICVKCRKAVGKG